MVDIVQGLPRVTQFLDSVLTELAEWRQTLNPFPVVTWQLFINHLHDAVNPLAGDEHLKVNTTIIHYIDIHLEIEYNYTQNKWIHQFKG